MRTDTLPKNQLKKNVPDLRPGQVVRVHEKIQEGNKERVQIFEGLVIAVKHGKGLDGTFTVRKIGAGGIGVERIFPVHMPAIEKIEVLRQEKVRRGKLYFVREQVGKKTKKRKTKMQNLIYDMGGTEEKEEEPGDAEEAAEVDEDTQAEEVKTEDNSEVAEAEEGAEKKDDKEPAASPEDRQADPPGSENSSGEEKEDNSEDNESKPEDGGEEEEAEEAEESEEEIEKKTEKGEEEK